MRSTIYEKAYGKWSGEPKGHKPNYKKCAKSIYVAGSYKDKQCSRKRGYGPDKAFCKTHAKKYETDKR